MTSGFVTETVARLGALDLVTERPAPPTGGRGRPTTTIHPHPRGPLVVAAAIGHETWKLAVAQLGGTELVRAERAHRRDPDQVLDELGSGVTVCPQPLRSPHPVSRRLCSRDSG